MSNESCFKSGKNELSGKSRNPGATQSDACTTAGTSYPTEIKRNSRVVVFPKSLIRNVSLKAPSFHVTEAARRYGLVLRRIWSRGSLC